MEVCAGFELIAIEDPAALGGGSFQIGKGLEVPVGERLIQNRPEVLGRLQFGRVDAMGAARGLAQSSLDRTDGCPMPKPNDLSRSLTAFEQDSTLIVVIEMSQASW